MITIIEGNLGVGKTLLLVIFYLYSSNKTCYTNFYIDNIKNKIIKEFDISVVYEEKHDKSDVFIDEAYNYFESRLSMSFDNVFSTEFVFQSRKKGMDLFLTIQDYSSLDKRIKNLTDVRILCEKFKDYKAYRFTIRTKKTKKKWILTFDKAELIYPLYNTFEVITTKRTIDMMVKNNLNTDFTNEMIANNLEKFVEFKKNHNVENVSSELVKVYCSLYNLPKSKEFQSLFKFKIKQYLSIKKKKVLEKLPIL